MHQDVRNPVQIRFDGVSDAGRDGVRFADTHIRIHLQMKIDVVLQASPAGVALFDSVGSVHGQRDVANLFETLGFRHGVEKRIDSSPDYLDGQGQNDDADKHSTDVIGRAKTRADEAQNDRDGGDGGGQQIGEIVPGVGLQTAAIDMAANAEFGRGQKDFEHDRGKQRVEGVSANVFRFGKGGDAMPEDSGAGQQKHASDGQAG